jgi:Dolichyl-phosphate-mannose-protein mannosyltransferase/F5/8 type C domain
MHFSDHTRLAIRARCRSLSILRIAIAALSQSCRFVGSVLMEIGWVLRTYVRIDRYIGAIILCCAVLFVPPIGRVADNAPLLAAFMDDEVWQALALDGTLTPPYGNPANFLDPSSKAYQSIPAYWGAYRYPGITYYGGAMYQIAMPAYAFLRLVGLPSFPTVVIVLRTITVLSALLTLIVLYNFACRFGTRTTAMMAVLFLVADNHFVWFSVHIHPDLLQVLFGLFALVLAIRHAERGDLPSVATLGIACGLVQGTKMGGVWTVPMAALALWWGLRASGLKRGDIGAIVKRPATLGAASLVGWFVATPYALFDSYYFHKLAEVWALQGATAGDGPFGSITIGLWATKAYEYIGPVGAALCGLSIGRVGIGIVTGRQNRAFMLALVLSASQFVVYGSGKFWVVLYYLLLTAALMAVVAFDALVVVVCSAVRVGCGWISESLQRRVGPAVARTVLVSAFGLFYAPYALAAVNQILDFDLYRDSSAQAFLNEWAMRHVAPDQTIMFDNYAYFDPAYFIRVIREPHPNWRRITGYDPDYLIIASWIYESEYFKPLIETQALDVDDTHPFSVRVYQDLLKAENLGPTHLQGIEYVARFTPQLSSAGAGLPTTEIPGLNWATTWISAVDREWRQTVRKASALWRAPDQPLTGCEFRVYHLIPAGTPNGRPIAFASSERPGHKARQAFDGTAEFWEAAPAAGSATEQYIGYDFGDHSPRVVREVRVEWAMPSATPRAIRVEGSDDGKAWTVAGRFEVPPSPAGAADSHTDVFRLELDKAHRFWRLVADTANHRFAVAELYFTPDEQPRP